ncbi:MAG: NUDIX hydrolase [Bacteroidales bacterium]|nr:NUDIX hydrolase [Bacteroidales bacterium]
MAFEYEYQHPALAADCVVFGFDGSELNVLLIKRGIEPFINCYALPGGFVHLDETIDECARRELYEETGLRDVFMEQLYTFGALNRDPRERVVSVAYYALVRSTDYAPEGGTDAAQAGWFKMNQLPPLAFDHLEILKTAHQRLKNQIRYRPVGFELLDLKFTMTQLQTLYEAVLAKKFDRRNFSSKILKTGVLDVLDEKVQNTAYRAPRLLSFNRPKYQELTEKGFNFEI